VTHQRKMMLEELQRRNYAETTIDCYVCAVEDFSRYFNCSPDRLGPRHIREYQAALFQKRKFSPNTVAQHLAALRFFYVKTLKESLEYHGNTLPEEGRSPANDPQPGRSCTTHRRSSDSLPSHPVDDPLRHRSTTRGIDTPESQRRTSG
jgi:hypothetical protein